jgi:hypothetical protein
VAKKLSAVETLFDECSGSGINIDEKGCFPNNVKAAFYEDEDTEPTIILNKALKASREQVCAVAEEIGHYCTSCGNLLTDDEVDKTIICQQELRAKRWAAKKLVPINAIIESFEAGCRLFHDFVEHLGVTEEFFLSALKTYADMYGARIVQDDYVIFFDPPAVFKAIRIED